MEVHHQAFVLIMLLIYNQLQSASKKISSPTYPGNSFVFKESIIAQNMLMQNARGSQLQPYIVKSGWLILCNQLIFYDWQNRFQKLIGSLFLYPGLHLPIYENSEFKKGSIVDVISLLIIVCVGSGLFLLK